MKATRPILTLILAVASLAMIQTVQAIDTTVAGATKVALFKVKFDSMGRTTGTTIRSTGSKALDDYAVENAGRFWPHVRDSVFTVPIPCGTFVTSTPHGKIKIVVITPRPHYPAEASSGGERGDGMLEISFDKDGRPIAAKMLQSTGSSALDANTVNTAYAYWRSSGGEKFTLKLPVSYQIHPRLLPGVNPN